MIISLTIKDNLKILNLNKCIYLDCIFLDRVGEKSICSMTESSASSLFHNYLPFFIVHSIRKINIGKRKEKVKKRILNGRANNARFCCSK